MGLLNRMTDIEIMRLADAIDRLLRWQHRQRELKEKRKYASFAFRRNVSRQAAGAV
jgi:hypothetical protein